MPSQASERLKEMLIQWKDEWFIYELVTKIKSAGDTIREKQGLHGVPPWRDYERVVLDNSIKDINSGAFGGTDVAYKVMPRLAYYWSFPMELFYWNRESRRVFVIPKDLQEYLARGTYPNLKWSEIKWPLDSFLLTLEQPLTVEDRLGVWVKYDTIFFSRIWDGKNEAINIRLFREPSRTIHREKYLSKFEKAARCCQRGEYDRARDLFKRGLKRYDREVTSRQGWRSISPYHSLLNHPNEPVKVSSEDMLKLMQSTTHIGFGLTDEEVAENAEQLSIVMKVVVGIALYINSVSSPPKPRAKSLSKGYRGVTGIITDADHICDVLGKGKIDPVQYGIDEPFERSSVLFVRPHVRRGYWRRPWGSAPNATKTVWVPWTIVRKDLIPEYGIISGTETKILPDD